MTKLMQRRLAAIVAADIVGFSRMIRAHEDETVAALLSRRDDLILPLVKAHRGRVANTAGDSFLIEFTSAVEAVSWAVAMQAALEEANFQSAESQRIRMRIGVNVGEVLPDGDDLLGDGVNVAARLEALAPTGGICLSQSAHEQIRDRLNIVCTDLGHLQVKNIDRGVHAFQVELGKNSASVDPFPKPAHPPASVFPAVAVLPFVSRSARSEHSYFGEGISEDIITELARFPELKVIARNTSFNVSRESRPVDAISRDLNARYLVDGTVRMAGSRVRITAQLLDGATSEQIWAERYDRELADLFDLQDEITEAVVANVPKHITDAELMQVRRKSPRDMSAYDLVLKGRYHHHKCTPHDNAEALKLLDAAIDRDPEYAAAYAWKACTLGQAIGLGCDDVQQKLELNYQSALDGLALDHDDIECHRILAEFGMLHGDWDAAAMHHHHAFALNPNDPRIIAQRAELLTRTGHASEGVEWIRKADRIDPLGSGTRAHLAARAAFASGDFVQALDAYRNVPRPRAEFRAEMAGCCAMINQPDGAAKHRQAALSAKPEFSISDYRQSQQFQDDQALERICVAMRKAGLPV